MIAYVSLNFSILLLHLTTATAFLPNDRCIVPTRSSSASALNIIFYSKTIDEEQFITTSLQKNSLFSGMPIPQLKELADAFEEKHATKDENIISQGDTCVGGYVYLVAEGKCQVLVDGNEVPDPYGTIGPEELFGELGILYEETRAATVSASTSSVTYYQILGETFKSVLRSNSNRSWRTSTLQEIDEAINQVSGTHALYGGDIIAPYNPEATWMWKQYTGTILKISSKAVLANMFACLIFVIYARHASGETLLLDFSGAPDQTLPFVQRLHLVVYQIARDVQGNLNNFNLVLATSVKRDNNGALTEESKKFLDDVGCYSRLFHILMWASKSKRFSSLATPEGLTRMESRGLMTARQLDVFILFTAPLEWMMIRSIRAMDEGVLASDTSTKGMLLRQLTSIRSSYCAISDRTSGRMPLAYTHLVQILVDTFVLSAPIALYADLGDYSIIAVGAITLFYSGLNNLAKIFLDPLNNENFCENAIVMDLGVLIRESNEYSTQWKRSGANLPF
ncbi:hypothetical protein FRACYDRAFT_240610 [Fragilariopsis cylindrus CCMP1102]|uniref:Cyclic nucleotide-binding domain-containing protein n=1 Tax=Fragilariopsis cylindrus CCMP1102 TaxID=635003 RepID=A0A1E7FCX5_9STRA|nr:hypothetical protein FRACYDRAFT_240610 [Fragilariopsis cylindrus CCMP1102]|eukprot:OEU15915.1 hypothetical protein FRACYDRAFT_240610 [Fragilariopsis cylindrus CCMP1102]